MKPKILFVLIVIVAIMWLPLRVDADFILTLNVSSQSQTEIVYLLSAKLTGGNAMDFIDSINASFATSTNPLAANNAIRFTTDQTGLPWDGGVGTNGLLDLSSIDPGGLLNGVGPLNIGRLKVDLTGLPPGTFTVQLSSVIATGDFGNGPDVYSGVINSPPTAFSISAVPEPSSLLSIVCISCIGMGVRRVRRRGAANNSASHRHEVGGEPGPDSSDCS